jgi:hypothetical protein
MASLIGMEGGDSWGISVTGETPQEIKEGRLKPPDAGNVGIPFARAEAHRTPPQESVRLQWKSTAHTITCCLTLNDGIQIQNNNPNVNLTILQESNKSTNENLNKTK